MTRHLLPSPNPTTSESGGKWEGNLLIQFEAQRCASSAQPKISTLKKRNKRKKNAIWFCCGVLGSTSTGGCSWNGLELNFWLSLSLSPRYSLRQAAEWTSLKKRAAEKGEWMPGMREEVKRFRSGKGTLGGNQFLMRSSVPFTPVVVKTITFYGHNIFTNSLLEYVMGHSSPVPGPGFQTVSNCALTHSSIFQMHSRALISPILAEERTLSLSLHMRIKLPAPLPGLKLTDRRHWFIRMRRERRWDKSLPSLEFYNKRDYWRGEKSQREIIY